MTGVQGTTAGVVLCGGQSRRMGMPKSELPFGDTTMLGRVVRTLRSVTSEVVVVASSKQEIRDLPSEVSVHRDRTPELGPLEGLYVGLQSLGPNADKAFVVSCDAPLLKAEFVSYVLQQLSEDFDAAVPTDQHRHWLCAAYRTSIRSRVDSMLKAGERKMGALLSAINVKELSVDVLRTIDPDLDSLRNVNHANDYFEALHTQGLVAPAEIVRRLQATQAQQ